MLLVDPDLVYCSESTAVSLDFDGISSGYSSTGPSVQP